MVCTAINKARPGSINPYVQHGAKKKYKTKRAKVLRLKGGKKKYKTKRSKVLRLKGGKKNKTKKLKKRGGGM